MPTSYRSLCLLDVIGKIFEFLLVTRVEAHMAATGVGLFERQFGFRNGRSTDDTPVFLMRNLREVSNVGRLATAMGLEIRNAFNSIGWRLVRDAPVKMVVRRILGSYLSAWTLLLCDDGGEAVSVT